MDPPPPPPEDDAGLLTVTVACPLLLEVSGSDAVEAAETDALATALPFELAVAVKDSDCVAPLASAPSVQLTWPPDPEHPLGSVLPRLTPLGSANVTVSALLSDGPAFVTCTV